MKTAKITLVSMALFLITSLCYSQSVEGKLSIKGLASSNTINQRTPVDLFKAFKEGVYSIRFNFQNANIDADQVVLFDMKTTLKYNGKTVSQTSRNGWPWIPGDMFVPIEAFDAIPSLQKLSADGLSSGVPFKNGSYEIVFQFVPSIGQKVKGGISPAVMKFNIK